MNNIIRGAFITATLLTSATAIAGPFAPAAGQVGSTAINMNDSRIQGWASGVVDYSQGSNVDPQWGNTANALGQAQGQSDSIVSLGRGGSITLSFDNPIMNGAGYDFAIFENSFTDTFLELAWVEISTNGFDFFRIPGFSYTGIDLTDPTNRNNDTPVGGFGSVDPTNVNGLAGKYRQGFGTPFDLGLFSSVSIIDINNINFIRLVDIIGDGRETDSSQSTVNLSNGSTLPWGPFPIYDPTFTFGSAGFDLDAIAVMNMNTSVVPLPASIWLFISGIIGLGAIRKKKFK